MPISGSGDGVKIRLTEKGSYKVVLRASTKTNLKYSQVIFNLRTSIKYKVFVIRKHVIVRYAAVG